jgi:hypothetical protein
LTKRIQYPEAISAFPLPIIELTFGNSELIELAVVLGSFELGVFVLLGRLASIFESELERVGFEFERTDVLANSFGISTSAKMPTMIKPIIGGILKSA